MSYFDDQIQMHTILGHGLPYGLPTPQAIEVDPALKTLRLYHLSNGACLRAEAFVDVRKPS